MSLEGGLRLYGVRVRPTELQTASMVAVGGAAGAVSRWLIASAVPWSPPEVPTATFMANMAGCVLIGVLLTWWTEGMPPRWWVRPLVAVGFVGGFTTFSAFAVEGVRLVDAGAPGLALGYIAGSVVVGVLLVRASALVTRRLLGLSAGGVR